MQGSPGSISPLFALVFGTVVFLVLVAMIINVVLVLTNSSSDMAHDLAANCQDTWKSGTGAIFGLIVGKTA